MSETKKCKYCKTEIPKDAKICPNCRKKQKGPLGIIIVAIVVLVILGAAFGGGGKSDTAKIDNSGSTTEKTKSENKDSTESAEKSDEVVQVGGSYEGKGLKFTVDSSELDYQLKNDEFGLYKLDDGLVYLAVNFTFENVGDKDKYVSIYDFKCYADDNSCEQQYVTADTGDFINTNLSGGRKVSFMTLYAVPADAQEIELEYEANVWTDEKILVKIK